MARKIDYTDIKVRFMQKVKIDPSGCWLWTGAKASNGYGYFRINGTIRAHKASHLLFNGPIPAGLEIDHLCRVRHCVNPGHLQAVTRAENMRRMSGRWKACQRNHPEIPSRVGYRGNGRRYCLECQRANGARYRKEMATPGHPTRERAAQRSLDELRERWKKNPPLIVQQLRTYREMVVEER